MFGHLVVKSAYSFQNSTIALLSFMKPARKLALNRSLASKPRLISIMRSILLPYLRRMIMVTLI